MRSFIVAGGGALLVLILLLLEDASMRPSIIAAVIAAYVVLASFWGVLRAKQLVMKFLLEGFGPLGFFGTAFVGGAVYGVLGGCVYEFYRCRKIARVPSVVPTEML